MPSAIITDDIVAQALLDSDFEYALILASGTLRDNGITISVLPSVSNASILNYGLVFSQDTLLNAAFGTSFTLRNLGDMTGLVRGVRTNDSAVAAVVNGGSIQSPGTAFGVVGGALTRTDVHLQNDGLIAGFVGVDLNTVTIRSFVNTGTITGLERAVLLADIAADGVIVNAGTISGPTALQLAGGTVGLSVFNTGRMDGGVRLGGGGDLFDSRGGTTTGLIEGLGGDDTLVAGTAFKALDGGTGNDSLFGGNGGEMLLGGAGIDELLGNEGNDVIRGGAGADVMQGGAGRDQLDYGFSLAVNVSLTTGEGSGGDATGDAFSGFEDIAGGAGNDTLTGDGFANTLFGRTLNDLLLGAAGNDHLLGQEGNDTLDGGPGADILRGGVGADRFRFADAAHSPNVAGQRDRILDFVRAEGDRIDLSLIDASSLLPGNQAFAFVAAGGAFTAAGQVRAVASGASYVIQGNTDANLATFEFSAILVSASAPVAADFVL
jgi:Ca2+-binding RTX toxin-like protein